MVELYPIDIKVRDLEDKLTGHLMRFGFHRVTLEEIPPLDKNYLEKRDGREISNAVRYTQNERWRSAEDYLLYNNSEGILAYVRPNPTAPQMYHCLPFEIHFRTAAPNGFSAPQYFSLVVSQRNYSLLKEALEELSRAIGSVIVATHLFSRKQIAYYKAAVEIDTLFSESALVA